MMPRTAMAFVLAACVAIAGCEGDDAGAPSSPVGAPCLPERVPDGGFSAAETYVEASSIACETRVCMVHELEGDPTCEPGADGERAHCADPSGVEESVYCTCRCDSGSSVFGGCICPTGFGCTALVTTGVRAGTYCAREMP